MKVTLTRRGGGGIASSYIMFGLVYRDKDKDNYKGNDRENKDKYVRHWASNR